MKPRLLKDTKGEEPLGGRDPESLKSAWEVGTVQPWVLTEVAQPG